MAIIGISSIHCCAPFIEASNLGSPIPRFTETGVMWQTIIHAMVFILSAIGIAYVDRLTNQSVGYGAHPSLNTARNKKPHCREAMGVFFHAARRKCAGRGDNGAVRR